MKNLILDIDSVGDDILAVLYGALSKDINLLGITTVNGACGSIEQAVNIALKIVEISGKDIKVYKGASDMLNKEASKFSGDPVNFDEILRPKFNERLDVFNRKEFPVSKKVESIDAEDFIINTIKNNKGVSIVATGPLTNIAKAILKDPSIVNYVEEIYVLGGCFKIPGNMTPVTEYNIWADPEAAKIVLNSKANITLVPLDVCENNDFADSMLTRDNLFDLNNHKSRVTEYICEKFPIYIDIWREFFKLVGFPMDDVITLAIAEDTSMCDFSERVYVDVELEGAISRGQTVAYFGYQILNNPNSINKNTRIVTKIKGKKFLDKFIETIKSE